MVVSIWWFQIFTWETYGNGCSTKHCQTSIIIFNWLFGVYMIQPSWNRWIATFSIWNHWIQHTNKNKRQQSWSSSRTPGIRSAFKDLQWFFFGCKIATSNQRDLRRSSIPETWMTSPQPSWKNSVVSMKLQRDKSNGQLAAEKERSSRQEGTVLTRVCRSDSGVKAH